MFNLENDPFELKDYAISMDNKKITTGLLAEINTFVMEEIQKGFEYPTTGKLRGRLVKAIIFYIPKQERMDFLLQTGRLKKFPTPTPTCYSSNNKIGHLGNNWCPAGQDYNFFEKMYYSTDEVELQDLINLYLWDGYGPNGSSIHRSLPKQSLSKLSQLWQQPLSELNKLWPNFDSYWNDPVDDW